jgi:hypothetical protein
MGSRSSIRRLAALLCAVPVLALAAPCVDFAVSDPEDGGASGAAAAATADGGFVAVWVSYPPGGFRSIRGRRYDAAGEVIGGEFPVDTQTAGFIGRASVAANDEGAFVVVWSTTGGGAGNDADASSIEARAFAANGTPLGGQFQVNTYTTGAQGVPSIAAAGDGFLVAWSSAGSVGGDADGTSIQGRLLGPTGSPAGAQLQVNLDAAESPLAPKVGGLEAGGFVVAWRQEREAYQYLVRGRLFDATATPLGPDLEIASPDTNATQYFAVAGGVSDGFVVVWTGEDGLTARRYDPLAAPLEGPLAVESCEDCFSRGVAVASGGSGGFLVAFEAMGDLPTGPRPSGWDVHARHVDAAGLGGPQFRADGGASDHQYGPAVAGSDPGTFLVLWTEHPLSDPAVHGQLFTADGCIPTTTTSTTTTTLPTDLLAATRLTMHETRGRKRPSRVALLSRDQAIAIDAAGGVADPTVGGGELRIMASDPAEFDVRVPLPANGWTRRDQRLDYRADAARISVRAGKRLKARVRGQTFALGGTDPTPITSTLVLGGRRLCMTFPTARPTARGHALVATGGATPRCIEPPN